LRARGAQHNKKNGGGKKLPDRGRKGGGAGAKQNPSLFRVRRKHSVDPGTDEVKNSHENKYAGETDGGNFEGFEEIDTHDCCVYGGLCE
jgi:hypothetical protein